MFQAGIRNLPRVEGTSPALRERLAGLPTAILSDSMFRSVGTAHLVAIHSAGKLVGNAVTVKTRPGDNLMIHKAFDALEAGDVLVVDAGGSVDNAIVGELIMQMAIERGVKGIVVDGAVRDVAAFRAAGFPCYARGVTHKGPYKDGPGEVNVPVAIDGMVVHPGDVIIGDEDGLLTIRSDDAESVLTKALTLIEKEREIMTRIRANSLDRQWIEPLLQQRGYKV